LERVREPHAAVPQLATRPQHGRQEDTAAAFEHTGLDKVPRDFAIEHIGDEWLEHCQSSIAIPTADLATISQGVMRAARQGCLILARECFRRVNEASLGSLE
jgi:hypothetical protein